MTDQTAKLEWRGGVPISQRFDDPYYSLEDGPAETRHVFLAGNDLPARFGADLHIAELGFGTGLNLLVTYQAWRDAGAAGTVHFTSFEAYPMSPQDMQMALAAFPALTGEAARLLAQWTKGEQIMQMDEGFTAEVIIGDARHTVPAWQTRADAWYLDGFSPAKNPDLWDAHLLAAVGRATTIGGTAATYSAAGVVRRRLEDAGFAVTRVPGYGRKRHMTKAVKHDAI